VPQQISAEHEKRAHTIDEFGELDRQLRLWAPTIRRHNELRKIIQSWFELIDPELGATAAGHAYQVIIGPKANHRLIDCRKLFAQIGDNFFDWANFPLEQFEALRIDSHGLITEERSGSRSVTPVPLVAAVVPGTTAATKKNTEGKNPRGRPRKIAA